MLRISYLLIIVGASLALAGCGEIAPEVEKSSYQTPVFTMNGQVIGNRSDGGNCSTDLSFQILCSFFTGKTSLPILEISFEEDEGMVFLRAYDGQSNIYRLLDLDSNGDLRLTYLGGGCKGSNCRDCTKSGSDCICDDSNGSDDDCGELTMLRY